MTLVYGRFGIQVYEGDCLDVMRTMPDYDFSNYSQAADYNDSGSASRFFPVFRWESKAPTSERTRVNGKAHETVKSAALLRWMSKLICPPGGTILDCFAGTGTTGQAARAEGFPAILIEEDPVSIGLIKARLDARPKTDAAADGESPPADEPLDLFALLDGGAS